MKTDSGCMIEKKIVLKITFKLTVDETKNLDLLRMQMVYL